MSQMTDEWLSEYLPKYELLGKYIVFILENQLQMNGVDYLSVNHRTKTRQGVYEKIDRKKYKFPSEEMMDFSGVRVILYFESDIDKVSAIINSLFNVDDENSVSNESRLSSNKIGYRSIHYVCDIGEERNSLVEYEFISGLKCEIQVRTMLQHAWAELTHDRNYKLSGKLPLNIERKINLYSGMLEIADIGFSEIISAVSAYQLELEGKNLTTSVSQSIDSLSILEFARQVSKEIGLELVELKYDTDEFREKLINEIAFMGITNFTELRALIPDNYASVYNELDEKTTYLGFIRDLLLFKDFRRLHDFPDLDWGVLGPENQYDVGATVDFYSNFMPREEAQVLVGLYEEH